ncbi:energy coupling factor transporter S component ThiW [Proteiniborus sp. MB09-C3]|uniref:energy coupling factor transporter S component ThiW n=1 Tax=Proteiniborus sp. MB09-C3 TaxID=3050072 RepID=UPI0025554C4A|nr:energy coupling factor transporter S component ThiW [Proteiniborus sp. MB09-C3]WIV12413.1 energy coupling factor transporter S component ThiW [Proteiniborus sp. MB09-C3]
MSTKKLTLCAFLIAIGTLAGHIFYIPVGVSKCFPIQHTINILSAVILGPWYAAANAFATSLLRNILGTGSLLAFPGSMIGAFLAGFLYRKTGKHIMASLGEVLGTGILGGLVAYPVAKLIMGKDVAVFFFVLPFMVSTIGGTIIGNGLLKILVSSKLISITD